MKELFITNVGSHMWKMETPQSDIDMFVTTQTPTVEILSGLNAKTSSTQTGFPGEPGKVERQSHEIGKVVEQLLKNNWNFITGVLSPIVIQDWERLEELRLLTRNNLSNLAYNSIAGMAKHNYLKYIINERDDSQKRCDTIARTIKMGINLFLFGKIEFEPVHGTTKGQVLNLMGELEQAKNASILPELPKQEKEMRQFLLSIRLGDL